MHQVPINITLKTIPIFQDASSNQKNHVLVLDGWRGLSILLVLAAHLLPLSPKAWQFNVSVGISGMVLFFILSGFLITSFLLKDQGILRFLTRRFFRIVPLAWFYLFIALSISGASFYTWVSHYIFYANLPPVELIPLTEHIWSLCVEVQFYVCIAILVTVFGVRGLLLIPVLALLFTALRVWFSVSASSITYFRIDEILAGCILALVYHDRLGFKLKEYICRIPVAPVLLLFILSCMPQWQQINYFRPYLAAILIGTSILNPNNFLANILNHKFLLYCASISYALYVIHPLLAYSWLGSGDTGEKYLKRPLLFFVLFIAAHISTHNFEKHFISFGRKLTI